MKVFQALEPRWSVHRQVVRVTHLSPPFSPPPLDWISFYPILLFCGPHSSWMTLAGLLNRHLLITHVFLTLDMRSLNRNLHLFDLILSPHHPNYHYHRYLDPLFHHFRYTHVSNSTTPHYTPSFSLLYPQQLESCPLSPISTKASMGSPLTKHNLP